MAEFLVTAWAQTRTLTMPVPSLRDRVWVLVVYLCDSKCWGPEALHEALSTHTHVNKPMMESV